MIDLVATLILEADEKINLAEESITIKAFADGIYHAYSAFINAAKALLLNNQVQCNTQLGILKDFDTHLTAKGLYNDNVSFRDLVLQINQNEPTEQFAKTYLQEAKTFIEFASAFKGSVILQ
jgi:sulfite reductase (ferredoxin)